MHTTEDNISWFQKRQKYISKFENQQPKRNELFVSVQTLRVRKTNVQNKCTINSHGRKKKKNKKKHLALKCAKMRELKNGIN